MNSTAGRGPLYASAASETDPVGNLNLTHPPKWFLREGGADVLTAEARCGSWRVTRWPRNTVRAARRYLREGEATACRKPAPKRAGGRGISRAVPHLCCAAGIVLVRDDLGEAPAGWNEGSTQATKFGIIVDRRKLRSR